MHRVRGRDLQGGRRLWRLRGLSRERAAGDVCGGGLVPLQRGLPAGVRRVRGLPGGDLQGGGRQRVRRRRRLRARQRLLRLRGERDDAAGGLGALRRVRVPAGVREPRLRAVRGRLVQGGDERRSVPGVPRRRDDGLRALGRAGRLRGRAGLLQEFRCWHTQCRLPPVPRRLLRADDRPDQLHAVPAGLHHAAGRRHQPEPVRVLARGLARGGVPRDRLLRLPARLRPRRRRPLHPVRRQLPLRRRRRRARRLSRVQQQPRRQRRRRRLRLQRGLRRAQRAGVHGLHRRDLRERRRLRPVSRVQQQPRRQRLRRRLRLQRRLHGPERRAVPGLRGRQVQGNRRLRRMHRLRRARDHRRRRERQRRRVRVRGGGGVLLGDLRRLSGQCLQGRPRRPSVRRVPRLQRQPAGQRRRRRLPVQRWVHRTKRRAVRGLPRGRVQDTERLGGVHPVLGQLRTPAERADKFYGLFVQSGVLRRHCRHTFQ